MVITGIRYKIQSDADALRTASFNGYLLHYLRMFAFLGIIVSVAIGVDYMLKPQIKREILKNKFYQIVEDQNRVKYSFYTDSYHFTGNSGFYDHIEKGDTLTYYHTPILKTLTDVSYQSGENTFVCKPISIYGWLLIMPCLLLVLSVILLVKTQRKKIVKHDPIINLGIINAFLCIGTLIFTLFHIVF